MLTDLEYFVRRSGSELYGCSALAVRFLEMFMDI